MKLSEIARSLSANVIGNALLDVERVVHPADAEGPGDLALALSKDAIAALAGNRAGAVVIPPGIAPPDDGRTVLVYSGGERMAIAILTTLFDAGPTHTAGVHPTAVVAADAIIGQGVNIGPHAVVGSRTSLGDRTTVLANATIGAGAAIGMDCVIHSGVAIGDRVRIGDRAIVHANAVIGADGFSFIPVAIAHGGAGVDGRPVRIHSLGTVVIGDDVEIGAGTTIDRATLRQTRIGNGTKVDNQVQIGHNVTIGESCLICGMVGIAGSVSIGDRVLLGAGAGISDHVTIGSDAIVGAQSGVARAIAAGVTVLGSPAVPIDQWREQYGDALRLKRLYPVVADLRKRVEALEKTRKDG